ncbi:MAG: ribonuclease HII [Deltaproteobacteria bacterium]|nr:ribonuclease HII [Deltaproteobacteria bacterium]
MRQFELRAQARGFNSIAGCDEAGRGPLAGPVVAAAVILPENYINSDIRDSKALTSLRRERLHEVILETALSVGIGIVEPDVIDKINILRASLLAMRNAVSSLSPPADYILIDGINTIDVTVPQESIIRGDSLSISIAAASIIAKVSRDRIMDRYHLQYPQYNFIKNKGYGTKEHREAIKIHGRSKIHRESFNIKLQ